jgi:putative transcriptional regulator
MQLDAGLAGQFLLAMPQIGDPRFERSVIYILTHSAEGAMGFIINQRADDVTLGDIIQNLPAGVVRSGIARLPVFIGGPVEQENGFILHSDDWLASESFAPPGLKVALSQTISPLTEAAKAHGPENLRVLIGYAGWGAGQLESEIQDNAWLVAPGDDAFLFDYNDSDLYERIAKRLGVDLTQLSSSGGLA